MLVVNELDLAEAIGRLRGEWAERSGGSLTADFQSWNEVAADDAVAADVIVFPSRYLGELCVREWLRPVRQHVLDSDELDVADFFPLVRRELIQWNGQVMALPLGVDVPTLAERIDERPAILLLVEAAPKAVSNDRIGALFDPETMKPRITHPPFVDALTKLVERTGDGQTTDKPAAIRVPVLGLSDRLAGVTASSRNAANAFKLLAWLAGPEASSQIARAGNGTLPARRSMASSAAWYDPKRRASDRADRGKALELMLNQHACLIVPRIPGIDEYLSALDRATQAALSGEVEPKVALQQAAAEWEMITDARGRDAQRVAYLKHMGLTQP